MRTATKETKTIQQQRDEWFDDTWTVCIILALVFSIPLAGLASAVAIGIGLMFWTVIPAIGCSLVVAALTFAISLPVSLGALRKSARAEAQKKFPDVGVGADWPDPPPRETA